MASLRHKVILHAEGKELSARYETLGELGHGSFGTVFQVRAREDAGSHLVNLAAKVIKKSALSSCEDSLRNEIKLLDRLDHPHIVRIYEVFEDAHDLCLVMELCEGGEVCATNGRTPEEEVASLVSQVLGALIYMHEHGVCHRDIKPSNILFKDSQKRIVKVADFGISSVFCAHVHGRALRRTLKGAAGTDGYIAPEVIQRRSYTEKCDMWSLGVVTFVELTGTLPFSDSEEEGVRALDMLSHTSPDAREFVEALLQADPMLRPSSQEALYYTFLRTHAEAVRRQKLSSLHLPVPVILQGLQGMQKYARAGPLWRLAATTAAKQVDDDSLWEATKAFASLDSTCDGRIPAARCRELLLSEKDTRLRVGMSDSDVEDVVAVLQEDGFVDYITFLAAVLSKSLKNPKQLADTFKVFDTDADDLVNAEDLQALAGEPEALSLRLQELANAHGHVSFRTFAGLIHEESPASAASLARSSASLSRTPASVWVSGWLRNLLQVLPCCTQGHTEEGAKKATKHKY